MNWTRIAALVVKELLAAFRDPRARAALVAPPLIQLFLFAFAATLEVTNVPIGVLNQDGGLASRQLISRFERAFGVLRDSSLRQPRRGPARDRLAGRHGRHRVRSGFLAHAGQSRDAALQVLSTDAAPTARKSSTAISARSSLNSPPTMRRDRPPIRPAKSSIGPGTILTANTAPR